MVRKFHKDFVIFFIPSAKPFGKRYFCNHGHRATWVAMMSMVIHRRYPCGDDVHGYTPQISMWRWCTWFIAHTRYAPTADTPAHHLHAKPRTPSTLCVLYASYASAQIPPDIIYTQNPGHRAARGGYDVRGYRDTVFQTGYMDYIFSVILFNIISSHLICYNITL